MKKAINYCWIVTLLTFMISLPIQAQKVAYQKSSFVTKRNADRQLKEEGNRESVRKNRLEKRAAKSEKKLSTKAKYKHRKSGKLKGEAKRTERHEKRIKNRSRSSEIK